MKKLFVLLLLLSVILRPNYNVQAEEVRITYNKLKGIAYNQKIDGKLKSNTVTMFQMGDRIAYCVEPGVEITNNYYDIYTDWSKVNFTDELKEYIEKIGYYGYEYPGHQTNYYYIAAQELIWKAVRPDIEVTWTTGENMTGNVIDISKEKEEILNLVSKHDLKPSFSETLVKDEVGKTITLTDENNVLNDYDISESEFHKVVKDGNKLIITLNDSLVSEETLKLTRKHYDDAPLLVYSKGNSQKLAALRISTEKETYIKVANEEVPEIVEVPDTGYYDVSGFIGTLLVGVGLVLFKVH
mgnify:FL=1